MTDYEKKEEAARYMSRTLLILLTELRGGQALSIMHTMVVLFYASLTEEAQKYFSDTLQRMFIGLGGEAFEDTADLMSKVDQLLAERRGEG